MANTCFVYYRVVGEAQALERIKKAWEALPYGQYNYKWTGDLLTQLGIPYTEKNDLSGQLTEVDYEPESGATDLGIYSEDKWCRCDFGKLLQNGIEGIKVYYDAQAMDDGDYRTNEDEEHASKYHLYIEDVDDYYCQTDEELYKILTEQKNIHNREELDAYLEDNEDVSFHEYVWEEL